MFCGPADGNSTARLGGADSRDPPQRRLPCSQLVCNEEMELPLAERENPQHSGRFGKLILLPFRPSQHRRRSRTMITKKKD